MFCLTQTCRPAVRLRAAIGGFVIFFLCVSVAQMQSVWRVTYSRTHICASKGSSVELSCTYTHPSTYNGLSAAVERIFWFTKLQDENPLDLRADSRYAGRVQYHCDEKRCSLKISDLRESDTAQYRFRFMTNVTGGNYIGGTGVSLTVTGFKVLIKSQKPCRSQSCKKSHLECTSKCTLPGESSYTWYRNGKDIYKNIQGNTVYTYPRSSYSCVKNGYEDALSPSVCTDSESCSRVTFTDRRICAFTNSTVDISCTYSSFGVTPSRFWYRPQSEIHWEYSERPKDLFYDIRYAGRVQVLETERGHSTLRISNLRVSDSAEYRLQLRTSSSEFENRLFGTVLTVSDPDLQVQVIWSTTGPKLICHSSCIQGGRSPFFWFKNETQVLGETSPVYSGHVDPADVYSCAYQGFHSDEVYAPTAPSVLISPTGDIIKDTSVTLTCITKANPAPEFTWYKKNQSLFSREAQLVLDSVQTSDSGEYYCIAENPLGMRTSEYTFVNVKYGPKAAMLLMSHSAEIVEGSSVNLTCSSDANPAANYTWFKGNQPLLQGPETIYNFSSISSEDRGIYFCKSENQFGQVNSTSIFLDVQYAPKLPSVSLSPSSVIVEGSSVTLTCSSDANPAASYTWYKEDEDSPKASGEIFTIFDFRAEHSGNYYCEVNNSRGTHKSISHLIVMARVRTSALIGSMSAVFLVIILIAVFLWMGGRVSSTDQSKPEETPANRAKRAFDPVYCNLPAAAPRRTRKHKETLHYSSIRFFQSEADVLYSSGRPAGSCRKAKKQVEDDEVEYTTVKPRPASRLPGTRSQEVREDVSCVYSTVKPR